MQRTRAQAAEPLPLIAELADDLAGRAVRSVEPTGRATPDDQRALAGVAGLLSAIDRLLAAVVIALMGSDRSQIVAAEGLTAESWLRAVARRTGADAGMLLMAAERLADMPATLRGFRDGALSWGTVRGIVSAVRALTAEQRNWLDDALAGDPALLERLDGDAVVAAAERLVERARPDLHQQRADRAAGGERLVLQPGMDGSGVAFAAMDAETFAAVHNAIASLTHDASGRRVATNVEALRALARQRLRRAGSGAANAEPDREARNVPPAIDDSADLPTTGTPAASPDAAAPDVGGAPAAARPEMIVVTDISLLAEPMDGVDRRGVEHAAMALDTSSDHVRAVAQLLWRQDRPAPSLTRAAAQRVACDATLRPVLTDGSEVLGVAEPYARVSARLRAALVARDGGCRFAGCHKSVEVCDAHHVVHRVAGGPTTLSNLALLCRAHHRAVHEGRWRATLGDDGSMTFTRRGVTVHSLPRGAQIVRPAEAPPPGRRSRAAPGGAAARRPAPAGMGSAATAAPHRRAPGGDAQRRQDVDLPF